jgi:hypothetical protein
VTNIAWWIKSFQFLIKRVWSCYWKPRLIIWWFYPNWKFLIRAVRSLVINWLQVTCKVKANKNEMVFTFKSVLFAHVCSSLGRTQG